MDVLEKQESPLCVASNDVLPEPTDQTGRPITPRADHVERGYIAAHKALAIFEIVEMILVRLSFVDLLRVERVCRSWRMIMHESIAIRRALFLDHSLVTSTEGPELNPFFSMWFCPTYYCEYSGDYFIQHGPSKKFSWFEDEKKRDIILRERASWRRMWPSTVPVYLEAVSLHTSDEDPGPGIREHVDLEREHSLLNSDTNGLTLNGFMEAVVSLMNHSKSPEFNIYWKKTEDDERGRPRLQLVAVLNPSQLISQSFSSKPVYPGISQTKFVDLLGEAERARFLAWTPMVDVYYDSHVDWS
ncbi:hypothetical protein AbraIFM66950_008982 [Aspergillus brasiliensis]|nr:hypothetical protein AbraIFM66950_008982 [Aspergillus brasiliensis]